MTQCLIPSISTEMTCSRIAAVRIKEHRFKGHAGKRTVKNWELMVKSKRKGGTDDDQVSETTA